MERSPLFPLPEGISIEQIRHRDTLTIRLSRPNRVLAVRCVKSPPSMCIASTRTVADVLCGGRSVVLRLCVRKKDGSFVAFFRSLLS